MRRAGGDRDQSAETYRALQTRTSDLQESLEHQAATIDVLKVMSRDRVRLAAGVRTDGRDRRAGFAMHDRPSLLDREGEFIGCSSRISGIRRKYLDVGRVIGSILRQPAISSAAEPNLNSRVVHVHDVTTDPHYPAEDRLLG